MGEGSRSIIAAGTEHLRGAWLCAKNCVTSTPLVFTATHKLRTVKSPIL